MKLKVRAREWKQRVRREVIAAHRRFRLWRSNLRTVGEEIEILVSGVRMVREQIVWKLKLNISCMAHVPQTIRETEGGRHAVCCRR